MKLNILFGKNSNKINLPRDYRKFFISFIKNIFERVGILDEIYFGKKVKPFTFSVFLGKGAEIIEEEVEIKPPLNFLFSSGDPYIFTNFLNGVMRLKKENKGLEINKKLLKIDDLRVLKERRISSNKIIFKTLGICVLTNPWQNAKNFEKWFITPLDNLDEFVEVLKQRTKSKIEILRGKSLNFELNFSFDKGSIKEVFVEHYRGYLRGFKGWFCIETTAEVLKFIYDYGLGVRTGQGFGLLDIIKEEYV